MLGFGRITLETNSVMQRAIALYMSYGFRPHAAGHVTARCDRTYVLDLAPLPEGR
jgi:hypothetical protein